MAVPDGLASYAWVAATAVVAPGVFGFGVVRWLGLAPAHGLRIALGFGYVVGHYVLAHATLAWLMLGKPFPGFLLPITALFAGLWLANAARRREPAPAPRAPAPWWSWLPAAVLVLVLLDSFAATNVEPLHHADETVNWAAKAKVLYAAPGFALGRDLPFLVSQPDYPLLNPLAQVLAFAGAGRVLQWENRLPIQFFAIALVSVLSGALARRSRPVVAALTLLAFAGTSFSHLAPTAYADVMLACCTLVAAEALLRWREQGDAACFAIARLAGGAMVSSKNEGTLLCAALAAPIALDAALRRWRGGAVGLRARDAAWLVVPAAAWALHHAINAWFGIVNDLARGDGRGMLARAIDQLDGNAGRVLRHYGAMLVDAGATRLLALSFLVAAPFALWLDRRERRAWGASPVGPLAATFVLANAGYMLVFVGTHYDLQWHLDVAADRTLQHVLPLAALGLAAAVAPARRSS